MATRIYAINPGETLVNVRENIGPTATSAIVALVVNLAAGVTGEGGVARGPKRSEVLLAINYLQQYLIADQDPPA